MSAARQPQGALNPGPRCISREMLAVPKANAAKYISDPDLPEDEA